ncbi:MAG TPA: O-antigen ligase family protein [Candidatus Moranbacteria bacterium]|nr:O-antigen ligase family protein [Candidatus Moranbacteria bacterium]
MIFIFFLFICFYLPFQIALNPAPGIDLASIRIFILFLFFAWLYNRFKNKKEFFKFDAQAKLILFFLFLGAVSLFFAQNYGWALRKLAYLFSIFPIYFIAKSILDRREKIIKTLEALVLSGLAVSIFGIFQFFSQFFWSHEKISSVYLNFIGPVFWGENLTQMVLKYPSWFVGVSGQNYFRGIATFPDPHSFSLFLGMMLPLSVILFFTPHPEYSERVSTDKASKLMGAGLISEKKKIWAISFISIFLANILTFSRGGYLAIASGALVFLFIFWKRMTGKYKLMTGLAVIFYVLMLTVPGPVSERFDSSFDLNEGSNAGRINMWRKSLEIIREKPFFGTGIGNFSLEVDNTAIYRNPIYAHNTYLDIAVEEGVLASAVWILILFITLLNFWIFSKRDMMYAGFFASLIIFSAHSLAETGLYSPVVLALFLILISFNPRYEK